MTGSQPDISRQEKLDRLVSLTACVHAADTNCDTCPTEGSLTGASCSECAWGTSPTCAKIRTASESRLNHAKVSVKCTGGLGAHHDEGEQLLPLLRRCVGQRCHLKAPAPGRFCQSSNTHTQSRLQHVNMHSAPQEDAFGTWLHTSIDDQAPGRSNINMIGEGPALIYALPERMRIAGLLHGCAKAVCWAAPHLQWLGEAVRLEKLGRM